MEKAYTDRELFDLAELYKIFGDPTRIRILCAMLETELCVTISSGVFLPSLKTVWVWRFCSVMLSSPFWPSSVCGLSWHRAVSADPASGRFDIFQTGPNASA